MAIKHFCDVCGSELSRNYVSDRLTGDTRVNNVPVNYELTLGVGTFGKWNDGEICTECLRSLFCQLLKLEPRPTVANLTRAAR